MNPNFPIDLSLAEVLQWREQLRLCCQGMSVEEELAYLHREAEQTLRKYGLKMIPISQGMAKLEKI